MTDDAFGHWLSLTAGTPDQVPDAPGVVQVKVSEGLVVYPTGRSAMVAYRAGPSCRAVASALCEELPWSTLAFRLRFRLTDTPDVLHAKQLERFVERFGAAPSLPVQPP